MSRFYFSGARQKIVLLLLAGVTLSISPSPRTHWTVIKALPRAWREINRKILIRTLREFYNDRLVDFKMANDGTSIVVLTEKGRKYALRYKIDEISIPTPKRWDKKWRVVIFDIPEKYKRGREALRNKLTDLGMCQLQKSVWVFPYPCKNEINFIVEVFEIRRFVNYIESSRISNDAKLKLHFKLY